MPDPRDDDRPAADMAAGPAPDDGAAEPEAEGASIVEPDLVEPDPVEPDPVEPGPVALSPEDELRAALQAAERERDEYLDQAQRNRAEYLNLRRRSEEQLAAALDRGAERLLAQLLGVLDNLGYVVDAADAEDGSSAMGKGVTMVSAELFEVLGGVGLEPVPGAGTPFDPRLHEALLSEESEEPLEEPVVAEVLRKGWLFKGRVLRPASVKVAR